jgi:predicted  nucleic acid-binding Zn-ribbon protein
MYSDTASAARDLQAMNEEVHHLESRRSELEDVELELMEEQEPVDRELAELATERAPLAERAAALHVLVVEAEAAVDAELRATEASRATEAAALPPDLAERYEKLRVRLKGTGAARLIGNRCDGCHLELPSVEVERIRHLPAEEVVTCDQCGRILVRSG